MDGQRVWSPFDVAAQETDGIKTLEVRWIHAGPLPPALIASIAPTPTQIEIREDRYLVAALLRQIGLKVRGGVNLDFKVSCGSQGDLQLPGDIHGRLGMWQKWTMPVGVDARLALDLSSGWISVQKLRRKRSFAVVGRQVVERPIRDAAAPGCTVELTEVRVGEEVWWTIGVEAGGPEGRLERDLIATAAHLFRAPLPAQVRLDRDRSMSYVEWLRSMDTTARGLSPDENTGWPTNS